MQGRKNLKSLDTETVPLNATNLQSILAAQSDRVKLIHNFIESQRTYLGRYASEGRAASAAWDRDTLTGGGAATRAHEDSSREILASAFDTPVLKPRVPVVQEVQPDPPSREDLEAMDGGARAVRSKVERAKASKVPEPTVVQPQSHKENVLELGIKHSAKHSGRKGDDRTASRPVNKQLTLDRYATKAEAKTKQSNKRQHSPDSPDPEHSARLAERRERRRMKRAIVAPKVSVSRASDEEDGSTSGRREVTRGKRAKKSTSLAAGLALMHGFTAKNIGTNRLTAQPQRRNGVFNKGKASANVGIATNAKRGAITTVFSETEFLNQSKRRSTIHGESFDGTSSKNSRYVTSSDSGGEEHVQQRLELSISNEVVKKNRSKRSQFEDDRREAPGNDEQQSQSSISSTKQENMRAASIVWDIEHDGKSLPSGSECTGVEKPDDGTVVLNTQSKKWTETMTKPPPRSTSKVEPVQDEARADQRGEAGRTRLDLDATLAADRTSTVSLRPSESASQLPTHPVSSTLLPHASRFFAPLPIVPSGYDNNKSASAVQEEAASPLLSPSPSASEHTSGQYLPSASHIAPQAVGSPSTNVDSLTRMCPAPISLSILDRELQALDDDDRGLLYAVHSQDLSTHRGQDEQDSQFGVQDPRQRSNWLAYSALPEAHEWYDQSECVEWQEGPVDSVMAEADTEATWHADFIDDELGRLDDWQEAFNAQIGLEDAALSYWDGEPAEGLLGFTPAYEPQQEPQAEERPESYACDQKLYEDEEESFDILQGPSRPQTTSSWCSATSEQAMSYSPSALASEVSTELLVPQFAQGRDLLLGLTARNDNQNSYSIHNVEEDVARSLRGHWLPQRS